MAGLWAVMPAMRLGGIVTEIPFTRGLRELGGGCHAWLEPDGSWGWSNAGLVVGRGESLLVDRLFDVPMTRAMLDGMSGLTSGQPIRTVFNTHSNGDHWYGNQLLADAEIIATQECAEEMRGDGGVTPAAMLELRARPASSRARSSARSTGRTWT